MQELTMQPFLFHSPTKILFGEDTVSGIGDVLSELGGTKPLIVTDANLVKAGLLGPIFEALKSAGHADPVVFDQVPSDSDIGYVRAAVEAALSGGCDCVISVGGGSVIDTGKVADIGLTFKEDVLAYEGMNTVASKLLPHIAVPTTAGTGSEVSAVALIKDGTEDGNKLLFGSRFVFPDVAILDPKLLLSLPPGLTAGTGMDALTHAIESYVATTTNHPAEALCIESMRLLFKFLPIATKNGADMEARSGTLVASMMAGLSFTNSGVGIVHALAHTIGSRYNTHHGITNGLFLPYGMEFNAATCSDKFASAYRQLCVHFARSQDLVSPYFAEPNGISNEEASKRFITAVDAVRKLCNVPEKLRDLRVPQLSESDMENLASTAMTDPAIMFNPREVGEADLVDILKRAY